ncbi:MAG TPA: hypothetical protein PLP17_08310, partial [Oligoflexia bacterium]|nr:hypothetical protein [Oligoflexia bacterium]
MTRINLHRAILPGSKAANGQTLAEVVAIVLLIAIACLIGVRAFGKSIKCKYYSAAAQVDRHAQIAEECQADEAAPPPSSPGSPPSPGTPPEPENPQPEPPLPNPED